MIKRTLDFWPELFRYAVPHMAISKEQEISATQIAVCMILICAFAIVASIPRPTYKREKKASKRRSTTRAERVFGLKRKDKDA